MFHQRFRLLRTITSLASRPAMLLLLWTHRRTVAMWFRSLRGEWDRGRAVGRHDVDRWRRLIAELGRATAQADPASPAVRVVVVGDEPDLVTAAA